MPSVKAIYKNGKVILKEKVDTKEPVEVRIMFPSKRRRTIRRKKQLNLDSFSFKKSQELLRNLKSSLSDEVIKERKIELWNYI